MKKMIIALVFSLFALPGIFGQQNVKLAVGMKAPDWMFTDAEKKEFTMEFMGRESDSGQLCRS